MYIAHVTSVLACAVMFVAPACADLTKVNRAIAKEPVYKDKAKYCLLVIGEHAKTAVWIVIDGDVLYADRNGNGDLTEPGERIVGKGKEGEREFEIGDLKIGELTHSEFAVYEHRASPYMIAESEEFVDNLIAKTPKALVCVLFLKVQTERPLGKDVPARVRYRAGYFTFADRAKDAPVVHMGGSWTMTLLSKPVLVPGRDARLRLGIGTPGHGPGTFAFVCYEGVVPEGIHPSAEILFPARDPGVTPAKSSFVLRERC